MNGTAVGGMNGCHGLVSLTTMTMHSSSVEEAWRRSREGSFGSNVVERHSWMGSVHHGVWLQRLASTQSAGGDLAQKILSADDVGNLKHMVPELSKLDPAVRFSLKGCSVLHIKCTCTHI